MSGQKKREGQRGACLKNGALSPSAIGMCAVDAVLRHVFSKDFQDHVIPGQETKAELSLPQGIWMKTGSKIRFKSKRRYWRQAV